MRESRRCPRSVKAWMRSRSQASMASRKKRMSAPATKALPRPQKNTRRTAGSASIRVQAASSCPITASSRAFMRSGRLKMTKPVSPCTSLCTQSSASSPACANGTAGSGRPQCPNSSPTMLATASWPSAAVSSKGPRGLRWPARAPRSVAVASHTPSLTRAAAQPSAAPSRRRRIASGCSVPPAATLVSSRLHSRPLSTRRHSVAAGA